MCREDQMKMNRAMSDRAEGIHVGLTGPAFSSEPMAAVGNFGSEAKAMLGGKAALRNRAGMLREEAETLEALARSIPEDITPAADQALIRLAYGGR
jgi:hypothetical protein